MCDLNLIVTCTDRKRFPPAEPLRARDLPAGTAKERCRNWLDRLRTTQSSVVPAIDLYMGNHWHVVRNLVAKARTNGVEMRVWVLSAGYGLIPLDARIKPYAASFALGADQVVGTRETPIWWAELAEWTGPVDEGPRTVYALAQESKDVPMLVVASAPYVRAAAADLVNAKGLLTERHMALISTGFGGADSLSSIHLRSDMRLRKERGGTAHTLNINLASWAFDSFEDWRNNFSVLREQFERTTNGLAPWEQKNRQRNTDSQVVSFIKERLAGKRRGYTVLLEEFREKGLACEQNRFRQLYRSVVEPSTT